MSQLILNPFELQREDSNHNACITTIVEIGYLGSKYLRSADSLVDAAKIDSSLLDVHVYAICFLYRQGLELVLKDLLWKSEYVLTGKKRFAMDKKEWGDLGNHRLGPLWRSLYKNSVELLGDEFPLDAEVVLQVETLFKQFEEHDPDSYAFRYTLSKRGGQTLPNLTHVNIRLLADSVHHVDHQLSILAWHLDFLCEQSSEYGA